MANRVMTLYVEDSSIKLLVTANKLVERWISIPLEPGLVSGGAIVDEIQVAAKIKEAFTAIKHVKGATYGKKQMKGSDKGKIIVGLSGQDSLYRVLALPVLSDDMLGEAVNREAARVLPVDLDELYIAYQRIPGFANETRVFMAAYPKKTTDTLLRTLDKAGIAPRVIDLAPLALCLSVNEPRSIIVDVRQDNLNIIVMAGRVPQVIRSLALQSEEKTVAENLTTIVEEFNRTVAFYNSSHPQELLDDTVPVFVSSDLANVPESWPLLVSRLNSPVAILPSAIQYPEDFPANEFAVNLGLATKELDLDKEPENYSLVNLNALPAELLPKQFNVYRVLIPTAAVAGLVGIVLLWMMWQNDADTTRILESQLTNTQNLIVSNAGDVAELTEEARLLQEQLHPILAYTDVFGIKIASFSAGRAMTDSDLHQIFAERPTTVNVTGVMYAPQKKIVSGISGYNLEILRYGENLWKNVGFNVVVSSLNYEYETTEENELNDWWKFQFDME